MHTKCPGFTLLEVMVAMAFIAITLMAILDAQSGSLSRICDSKFQTTAALLAQRKIAEIETENPEDLFSDSGDFGEHFPGYRWQSVIKTPSSDIPENITPHLKQIDLTIFWGENDRYSYRLRAYCFAPES